MVKEEERIFQGIVFCPGDPELVALKLRTHNLNVDYNNTYEDEYEKRAAILVEILGEMREGTRIQGPIAFHYGKHTKIGRNFFGNFNLTIQDDGEVTIGDRCNFGPNVTIVTPIHPMVPEERNALLGPDGKPKRLCYAKPVHIGSDVWLGANVVAVHHDHAGEDADITACYLRISVETKDRNHVETIKRELQREGFRLREQK